MTTRQKTTPATRTIIAPPDRSVKTRELADLLDLEPGKWDPAIKYRWAIEFRDITGYDPRGTIVWYYSGESVLGQPRPLTMEAWEAMQEYNEEQGTRYGYASLVAEVVPFEVLIPYPDQYTNHYFAKRGGFRVLPEPIPMKARAHKYLAGVVLERIEKTKG